MTVRHKEWTTHTLNIGESIAKEFEGGSMAVDHLDRRVATYAACVVRGTVVVYTGLHNTLADARRTCERKAEEFPGGS